VPIESNVAKDLNRIQPITFYHTFQVSSIVSTDKPKNIFNEKVALFFGELRNFFKIYDKFCQG